MRISCPLRWAPSVELASLLSSQYSRIRVAAKAYINTIFGPAYHPVIGTVRILDPPPEPPK
ncbi:hypothetical protein [Hyalangium sp.]|uniref:hypothetical protein n=1 Tax=Hyalangium sp. TaxID=2028555 RepID=UPI002D61BADD|nr:hypothetical protein [Hyalangium sp.]HYH94736.1 hypothetical protein [Hyalangium sp.]